MRLIDADILTEVLKSNGLKDSLVYMFINQEPTVDVEPVKHGYWVKSSEYKGDDISGYTDITWVCSECGEEAIVNEWYMYELTDYCPHCGAKME